MRRFDRDISGILLLDKPAGITSNAALQKARGLFRAIKAGHAGSLDPMASGMLPICLGEATKVCGFLLDAHKTYRFIARLGERTDTGDADGSIVERQSPPLLAEAQIQSVLQSMQGEQLQTPPMHSALKHQGERLYKLARRGEMVEREPRRVFIASLDLLRFNEHELEIEVRCSKGTYVRTLAEDIAARLGTIAHLTLLRRLQVDPFDAGRMLSLEQLTESAERGVDALDRLLMPPDEALPHLPAVRFDQAGAAALLHGQARRTEDEIGVPGWVRLYGPTGAFLGLGEVGEDRRVQPRRLFHHPTINP